MTIKPLLWNYLVVAPPLCLSYLLSLLRPSFLCNYAPLHPLLFVDTMTPHTIIERFPFILIVSIPRTYSVTMSQRTVFSF